MTGNGTTASRVIVGVDGSEQSKRALRWATYLAPGLGADGVDAVMVWQPPVALEFNMTNAIGDWSPQVENEKALEEVIDEVFGSDRPVSLRAVVVEGNPARRLLDLSRGARMLVVGSRGRGGFASMTLGSISVRCVEHAHCPVLVVREDEPLAAA